MTLYWTRTTETKQFSLKKDSRKKKIGLLLSVYSLSVITQANKQTNSFDDTQAPGLHITILHYLQDSDHNDDNIN